MNARVLPAAAGSVVLVCVAATLPYVRSIDNYFVQDDFGVVWLLGQKPWSYFPRWFVSTWMDNIWGYTPDEIRPFPALTYQVAAAFTPGSPVADHAINIALHAANSVLVLMLAYRVVRVSRAAATVAALAFAVLPMHAESVAWVTGRVDSMPAFFYLASFIAYARWRARPDAPRLYWGSVALFFVAIFSKQTAITLGPALVLYDAIIERRLIRVSWTSIRPYVPFALITLGYLGLRYVLFGEVARESQLTAENVSYFGDLVVRHLQRTIFGAVNAATASLWAVAALAIAFIIAAAPRQALYFGVLWWVIGVAPVLVAAYDSPRHAYLASVGWAVLIGLGFDVAARRSRRRTRAAAAAAALVIAAYSVQLVRAAEEWEMRASLSARASADLEREALGAPPGSLIIAGAPVSSWEWAAPFVLRPPFANAQAAERVTLITPWLVDCCRAQWEDETRRRLDRWLASGGRGEIVALRWARGPRTAFRLSTAEEPYLRSLVRVLLDTDSRIALDTAIRSLLDQLPPVGDGPT
jgi:hypothetical protein